MKWKDLKINDKIYILVPIFNEETNNISYEYQEVIIENYYYREKSQEMKIKFSYHDKNNSTKVINQVIKSPDLNNRFLCFDKYLNLYLKKSPTYGNIIIWCDSTINYKEILNKLINIEIQKYRNKIKLYNNYIDSLKLQIDS